MGESWRASGSAQLPSSIRRARSPLSGLAGAAAMAATGVALVAGAALAVVFAATLAVVMALATALLALSVLVWRMRRGPQRQAVRVDARRIGHSWVTYSWDGR